MNPNELVAAFAAQGVVLRFDGGDAIAGEADEKAPRELLDELRRCRAAVVAFLRMSGLWTDEAKVRDFKAALRRDEEGDVLSRGSGWGRV